MTWKLTDLTWPSSAAEIEAAVKPTINNINHKNDAALSKLDDAAGGVIFRRKKEDPQAAELHHKLEALLMQGHCLTVTPYDYEVGKREETGYYLAPKNALKHLAKKLRDNADRHLPTGELHAVCLLVTSPSIPAFSQALNELIQVLPIPELNALARRLNYEQHHLTQRMQTSTQSQVVKWRPTQHPTCLLSNVHQLLGTQVAQVESLASSNVNPVQKLEILAAKRANLLAQNERRLLDLKNSVTGQVLTLHATGSAQAIANTIDRGAPTYETPHTAAVLLVANKPLTFFKELLP